MASLSLKDLICVKIRHFATLSYGLAQLGGSFPAVAMENREVAVFVADLGHVWARLHVGSADHSLQLRPTFAPGYSITCSFHLFIPP